jgi:hypothetical protein
MIDFITLNPYEQPEDILTSILLALSLPKPYNLVAHVMNFFEGTPLKADALGRRLITPEYGFNHDLHDFTSHAKDAYQGIRQNSPENMYLSSVLFRMTGIHDLERCGFVSRNDVRRITSNQSIAEHSKNIVDVISEMESRYNPMKAQSF